MSANSNNDVGAGNVNNLQGNDNSGNPLDTNGAGGQGAVGGGAANDGQDAPPAGPAPGAAPATAGDGHNAAPPAPGAGAVAGAPPAAGGDNNDNAAVAGSGGTREDRRDAETTTTRRSQQTRFAETIAMQPAPAVVWRTAPDHGDINPGTKHGQTIFREITKGLPINQRLDLTRSNGPQIHIF